MSYALIRKQGAAIVVLRGDASRDLSSFAARLEDGDEVLVSDIDASPDQSIAQQYVVEEFARGAWAETSRTPYRVVAYRACEALLRGGSTSTRFTSRRESGRVLTDEERVTMTLVGGQVVETPERIPREQRSGGRIRPSIR